MSRAKKTKGGRKGRQAKGSGRRPPGAKAGKAGSVARRSKGIGAPRAPAEARVARPEVEEDSEPATSRLLFGDLIRAMGFATADQILECLNIQRREDEEGRLHRRLGEILVDQGHMTEQQLRQVMDLIA